MTMILNTIATPPRRSLLDDRNTLEARDARMTAARTAQHERDDRDLLICFLVVVLNFRAAAKRQFARETKGTNGYAGGHVETLDQFLEASFQRYERFMRNEPIRAGKIASLVLKGGH